MMTSPKQRKGKAHKTQLARDPISGHMRRFPMVTETHLRRNLGKVLALLPRRRVVFVTRHGKVTAVMMSPDAHFHWRLIAIRHERSEREETERCRAALEQAEAATNRHYQALVAGLARLVSPPVVVGTTPAPGDMPPPRPYANWLDYAMDTFDTRSVEAQRLFQDGAPVDREAIRSTARNELALLRTRAATAPMPQIPVGRIKTFGALGPKYQVGEPLCPLADGDWMIHTTLIETGEVIEYRLSQLLMDPDAQ